MLKSFIDENKINQLLAKAKPTKERVREIIKKSLAKNRLELEETATLLNVTDKDLLAEIFQGAKDLKELADMLKNVPLESFQYHGTKAHFSKWLDMHGEHDLAKRVRGIPMATEATRQSLITMINERCAKLQVCVP